jgi:hypothetical protein
MEKLLGFTYGPQTYTFQFLRKKMIDLSQDLRISEIELN